MVIKIKDHIERCYSNADGLVIYNIIEDYIRSNFPLTVSFQGIDSVTSSFVNSAFIELLNHFSFGHVKSYLRFVDSTSQINEMIKRRFDYEVNERKNLMLV